MTILKAIVRSALFIVEALILIPLALLYLVAVTPSRCARSLVIWAYYDGDENGYLKDRWKNQ